MKSTEMINAPSMTFLNATGDVTIMWSDDNREAVVAMIEKKGYPHSVIETASDLPRLDQSGQS